VSELESQQADRQRLIDMQNSQLRDLQQRLSAVEGAQPAASASAATPSQAMRPQVSSTRCYHTTCPPWFALLTA